MSAARRFEGGPARGLLRACGALLAATLIAHAAAAAPTRWLLVSIDGLAADTTRAGSTLATLTALAPQALRCDDAHAPGGGALPAWTELLTGCGPARTGVEDEVTRGLPAAAPTLAGALAERGVLSLALPADPLAHAGDGFARGFTRWLAVAPALEDSARADSALAWLGEPGPRFAWLALGYGAPAALWRRADGFGPYAAAARAQRARELDAVLARLLAGLARAPLAGQTLVAICGTGDGVAAGNRVPLLLLTPARAAGRLAMRVSLADVAPTFVAAAGGDVRSFEGANRLAADRAAANLAPSLVAPARAADAYALPPECAHDALALLASPPADSALVRAWAALFARCPGPRLALERDAALSRTGHEFEAARGLKPAAAAEVRAAIAYADLLLGYQRWDLVEPVLASVPDESPLAPLAWWRRLRADAALAQFGAAEAAARRLLALAPPGDDFALTPEALHALGVRADSVARFPRDGALRIRYALALGELELYATAYPQLHAARALLPGSALPDYWLASLLLREGRAQNAVPTLERALAADSSSVPARQLLAETLAQLGRVHEARMQMERLAHGAGVAPRVLYNLACVRALDGARAAALDELEAAVRAGYANWAGLATDPDLASLHAEPRWAALLAQRPASAR